MNIWSKVITALQTSDSPSDMLTLDSQAMKILDEEVRNTTQTLGRLEQSLATMRQQAQQCQAKHDKLRQAIPKLEGYAVKAMEQADEDLALAIAKKIAEAEGQLKSIEEQIHYYQSQSEQLQQVMDLTQQNLTRLRQQVDMVRASENVHRAQQTIVSQQTHEHGKVLTAMDALKRLKQRQATKLGSKLTDSEQPKKSLKAKTKPSSGNLEDILDDEALQQRLIDAGIIHAEQDANEPEVSDIMQRIKQRAEQPTPDNE